MYIVSLNKKIKRTDASFKAFCFLFKPFNETFWNVIFLRHVKTKRFTNIFFMNMIVLVLKFSHSNVYYFGFHWGSSNVTACIHFYEWHLSKNVITASGTFVFSRK